MEMAVKSMAMTPGALPHPGRVPEQRLLSPESCGGDGGGVETFRGFLIRFLGFSRDGEYMGEGAESTEPWWAQTQARRGPRAGRALA